MLLAISNSYIDINIYNFNIDFKMLWMEMGAILWNRNKKNLVP